MCVYIRLLLLTHPTAPLLSTGVLVHEDGRGTLTSNNVISIYIYIYIYVSVCVCVCVCVCVSIHTYLATNLFIVALLSTGVLVHEDGRGTLTSNNVIYIYIYIYIYMFIHSSLTTDPPHCPPLVHRHSGARGRARHPLLQQRALEPHLRRRRSRRCKIKMNTSID